MTGLTVWGAVLPLPDEASMPPSPQAERQEPFAKAYSQVILLAVAVRKAECKSQLSTMRKFQTGASRDNADNKIDYAGHLDPKVLEIFGAYMHKHRVTAEGVRASDDWKQGIPKDVYYRSLVRHTMQFWSLHEGNTVKQGDEELTVEDALCGILFNAMGLLREISKENSK